MKIGSGLRPLLLAIALLGGALALPAVAQAGKRPGAQSAVLAGQTYISAPALHPPPVRVGIHRGRRAHGLIFIDPFASSAKPLVGEAGALIMAEDGSPVWFHPAPAGEEIVDFRSQHYLGKPVLTWWQGTIAVPPKYTNLPVGSPEPGASFFIYNDHYRKIAQIKAPGGWTPDLHELLITPSGNALFIASKVVSMNLTPYGGPAQGKLEDFAVQEVNIRSGKLLFEWNMLEHVPLSEAQTAAPAVGIWDPYHMNSVAEDGRGALLVSARNTWAIYDVARSSGKVLWQLGGKGSTFKIAPQAAFYWQHDARPHGREIVSIFDDGCCNILAHGLEAPEQNAHGLLLKLDFANHTATLLRSYYHRPPLAVPSQGNVQLLANGNVFLGWGQLPYISEYTRSGRLLYEATLPEADESYRAFRAPWSGEPRSRPSVVAVRAHHRTTVYVSWNGATGVARWELLAGASPRKLHRARIFADRSFQSAITIAGTSRYFAVRALSRAGAALGYSGAVLARPRAGRAAAPRSARGRRGPHRAPRRG
jgi:hypothetical protein